MSFVLPARLHVLLLSASCLTATENTRALTRLDEAIARFGVQGKGVLIGIMDRGIDWRHRDFRNADGTTRISGIFDLTDDTGARAASNPFGVGTLYTKELIDRALANDGTIAHRDAVGHGTTTAGIAAGNGSLSPNRRWRGAAPESSLLIVKIASDGAPAHGSEPAEQPAYDPTRIPVGLRWLLVEAGRRQQPIVVLLNLGSIGGPTDGTSSLTRLIDEEFGPGKAGRVFICGTGDDGVNTRYRAAGMATAGANQSLRIRKARTDDFFFIELWYAGEDRYRLRLQGAGIDVSIPPPAGAARSTMGTGTGYQFFHYAPGADPYGSANGKRNFWLRLSGPPGDYTLVLEPETVVDGRWTANINAGSWSPQNEGNGFESFNALGSIWDGATSFYGIAPNASIGVNEWTDIDGVRRRTDEGQLNDMWLGSSVGPTVDGRIGTDVAVPADRIFTAYSPTSYWATFRFNLLQGGNSNYGTGGAVSAANPFLAGVAALMLEMNPTLDSPSVKYILQSSAKRDAFTGVTPNPVWGHGKLDAFEALSMVRNLDRIPQPEIASGGIADSWTYTTGIAPGTWVSIFGHNLSADTAIREPVAGEPLPSSLRGVSLRVHGVAVPIAYVSPTLINGLIPAWLALANVTVQVERNGRASAPAKIAATPVLPAIYALPVAGSSPPRFFVTAALAGTGTLIGNRAADARVTRGARAGEALDLYVLGLGRVKDRWITDQLFSGAFSVVAPVEVTLGGRSIPVLYSGLISPGLYLVRVTVPAGIAAGDLPLVIRSQARSSRENALLTVE